jgi:hypothetical protein
MNSLTSRSFSSLVVWTVVGVASPINEAVVGLRNEQAGLVDMAWSLGGAGVGLGLTRVTGAR